MNQKTRLDLALLSGILFSLLLTSFGVFARDCGEARETMLRLHIIANSDGEEDQRIKYAVRDRILTESGDLFSGSDKADALTIAAEHLADMERTAVEVLAEQGVNQSVKAEVVNMYFGTRIYGDTTVAAGWYDAVRVTIGEGEGQNWWCVMFPPMCLPTAQPDREELSQMERLEELGKPQYIPRFAVVELVEEIRNYFDPHEEEILFS